MDVPYSRWKVPSLLLIPLFLCFGILVFVDVFQLQYYTIPTKMHFLETSTKGPKSVESFIDVDRIVDAKSLKGFAIKTSGCRIPYMDPFDKSVKSAISEPKVPKCNGGIPPLFDSNLTHLFVVQSSLAAYNIVYPYDLDCCYQKFYRVDPVNHNDDKNIQIDKDCLQINLTQSIPDEFIKLTCKYDKNLIYKDLFAFVPVKTKPASKTDDKFNLLVIGLDAVSRVNFHRQMPHTAAYLKEIHALELMGYNKVGDNTFPNLIPVLTGHSEEEISKTCWPSKSDYFDNCSYLWDFYKNEGYTTVFGEDSTWMGIFNYNRAGFKKQPTDYGYSYFNRLAEKEIGNSHNMNVFECIGGRDVYKTLLSYVKIFAERMDSEKIPYFGFFWGASLSHDYLNKPKLGDYHYKSFFQSLVAENLKNTILVFMSDHGIRWGPIRQTYQGRLEERLPFVYIKLPEAFIEKYPVAYRNLIQNTRRLTTPFDLHYTLKSFLSLDNLTKDNAKKEHGYSLFSRIPDNRTCEDAGITSHWCTCQQSTELDVKDSKVIQAAKFAVQEMNSMLVGYAQCAELTLDKIVNARQMSHQSNKDIQKGDNNSKDYMLTVQTVPGEGIFEVTVRLLGDDKANKDGLQVIGTISRLNLYGKQSACITDYHLKLYCYCKSLI